jgi:hypothetical protein
MYTQLLRTKSDTASVQSTASPAKDTHMRSSIPLHAEHTDVLAGLREYRTESSPTRRALQSPKGTRGDPRRCRGQGSSKSCVGALP